MATQGIQEVYSWCQKAKKSKIGVKQKPHLFSPRAQPIKKVEAASQYPTSTLVRIGKHIFNLAPSIIDHQI